MKIGQNGQHLTGDTILQVNNLTVEFTSNRRKFNAIEGINFSLKSSETIGFVGESGSGKSVTSLSVLNLIPIPPGRIVSGEIWFKSRRYGEVNLLKLSPSQLRQVRGSEIAMIFQDPNNSLNPAYTCGNQVVEAIQLHEELNKKNAKLRSLELFADVKLPSPERIFNAYPHEISGGQKQRVMIAMALACNPSILIADEPTTALDVTIQSTILKLLGDLRDAHHTSIVFITHDLGVLAEIADHVMVMYMGKCVEQGNVWDIFSNPKHPYTKGLLACRPRLDIKFEELPVVSDFMQTDESGKIIEIESVKFNSVAQAIVMSYKTDEELRIQHHQLISQPPLLSVRDLVVKYPGKKSFWGTPTSYFTAVDGVSFDVYPGETLGLVGESGCGKSTLGRAILRLNEPTSGQIIFDGVDITKLDDSQMRRFRRDMQIVFQDPYASLNPRISVGEAIMEPLRIHQIFDSEKERKDYVVELLETVNLSAVHFDRYPHEFSGGQRQRICLARTIAIKPRFVVCDESVSALDVSVQAQVLNLLNRLKDKYNLTYIFISHDLAVVKFISDRIMVMNKGKIEEISFAEDVYDAPRSEYTRKLIASIPTGELEVIRRTMLKRKLKKRD